MSDKAKLKMNISEQENRFENFTLATQTRVFPNRHETTTKIMNNKPAIVRPSP